MGEVLAVAFMGGKMVITLMMDEEDDEWDDDDGEEITPEEKVGLTLVQPIKQAGGDGP